MGSLNADHPIRRMFAGLTEHTFLNILGMADPQLIDYLSSLLSRFIHLDAIYRLRNAEGRRLEEVADMMLEAEALPPKVEPGARSTGTSATLPCSGPGFIRKP